MIPQVFQRLQKGLFFVLILSSAFVSWNAQASRLKDIASIKGVRENQLVGYGLVVGLKGTGDGKAEYTTKSMIRMLESVGMKIDSKDVTSKNVAAVIITATLPPFARSGNRIDITVNSIGDAASLEGGTLVQTPLRAANQQVYAVAQGTVLLGSGEGGKNHPTVGRVPSGAIIERDLDVAFTDKKMFRLALHNPDFTTAARVVQTINTDLGGKYASAKDSGTVDVVVPFRYEGNVVELLALIEGLQVEPDTQARVVINEKTGTVVIGDRVRVSKVAISHGNLSVQVGGGKAAAAAVRGPASAGGGGERVALVEGETNVGDLVKALNSMGVSPKDLITILQNIKAAGAMHGDLDIL